jgi:hypothetical protein
MINDIVPVSIRVADEIGADTGAAATGFGTGALLTGTSDGISSIIGEIDTIVLIDGDVDGESDKLDGKDDGLSDSNMSGTGTIDVATITGAGAIDVIVVAGVIDGAINVEGDSVIGGNVTALCNSNRSYPYVDETPPSKPITTVASIYIVPLYATLIVPEHIVLSSLLVCVIPVASVMDEHASASFVLFTGSSVKASLDELVSVENRIKHPVIGVSVAFNATLNWTFVSKSV